MAGVCSEGVSTVKLTWEFSFASRFSTDNFLGGLVPTSGLFLFSCLPILPSYLMLALGQLL